MPIETDGFTKDPQGDGGGGGSAPAGTGFVKVTDGVYDTPGNLSAAEMPTGIDATKLADGSVSNAELQRINSLTSNVQDQIDGKAATSHSHAASDITSGTLPVAQGGTGLTALGTALHGLRVNAAGNALEFAALAGGGGLSLVCALRKSANQAALSNSSDTVVTYDTEDLDSLGFHSTGSDTERCTIPSGHDGDYCVVDIIPADWLGPYNLTLTHRKNGTKLAGGGQQQYWSNESVYYVKTIVVISFFPALAAGDYIDLVGYATSANCVLQGGSSVSCRRYLLKG